MDEFGRYTGQGEVTRILRSMGACLHWFVFTGANPSESYAIWGPFDHKSGKSVAERKAEEWNKKIWKKPKHPLERGGYEARFVEQGEVYPSFIGVGPYSIKVEDLRHGCDDHTCHLPPEYQELPDEPDDFW